MAVHGREQQQEGSPVILCGPPAACDTFVSEQTGQFPPEIELRKLSRGDTANLQGPTILQLIEMTLKTIRAPPTAVALME